MIPMNHSPAALPVSDDAGQSNTAAGLLTDFRPSRRFVLVGAAVTGAGLVLGLPSLAGAQQAAPKAAAPALNPLAVYLKIAPDNTVTVYSAHMDMGQGNYSGLATLVAEELDADWAQMRAVGGAGNPAAYGNVGWGGAVQGTGGSTAMMSSWDRYRKAGATARAMLVAAAAKRWSVPAAEITVANGVVAHRSGKRATFGELSDAAAQEAIPADVVLKQPAQWRYIGKDGHRRLDSRAKATGAETFTIDVRLPDMLMAVVAHPPLFGARVKSFDATAAKAVPGVVDVVQISRGVAVVAKTTWAAMRGREALTVQWDDSGAEKRGSAEIMAEYRKRSERPGDLVAVERGSVAAGLQGAAKVIEARYEFPYLAHAALEPLNAVARMQDGVLEIWGGHQIPDMYQAMGAKIAGVTPDKVRMHVMKTGGGFGRRAVTDGDVVVEAVEIAKAIGWKAPVKLQWTREDDMAGGRYRPMVLHHVRVGLDDKGAVTGWHHHIIGQSILIGTPFEGFGVKNGVDPSTVEGVSDTKYGIGDLRVEVTNTQSPVTTLWWRSVGHTHTAYAMETMIDEVAAASGKDPVALRRELLKDHPRHLKVLDAVAAAADWGKPLPAGRFRGIALHESFGTVVGEVAEISMQGRSVKVERVVCAIDCGIAVNPDTIRAQIEGGVGFGLGAILREQVTLQGGAVDTLNFDSYRPLRIDDMPKVEVHILPSTNRPSGVGEPGVPPIGPAVANAVFAATGKRVRILPFETGLTA